MFLHLSVILFTGGSASVHPGTLPPPGKEAPLWKEAPPGESAAAADGTHPTGVHSCHTVLGSKGSRRPAPPWTKCFVISCSFLGKSGKFVCWRPLLRGILDPPLQFLSLFCSFCFYHPPTPGKLTTK